MKHLVYRHYLDCWMPKILQTFRQATIVDAFAGPGVYERGEPGSPLVVARAYLEHAARARFGRLRLICLEERLDRVERLKTELAGLGRTPNLEVTVLRGSFVEEQARVSELAHDGDRRSPVLWLLDPFNLKTLPFQTVAACLAGPRDEAIITFFTNEIHRFCTREGFDAVLDDYYGSSVWRGSVEVSGERARKAAMVSAYRSQLGARGMLTGEFGVHVSNRTARYSLIFATHSAYGLQCWNPVTWKLDADDGAGASAASLAQPTLFGSTGHETLAAKLRTLAGTSQPWERLAATATALNFLEKHLRAALDELAAEGLAIRVEPMKSRTRWPAGCVVRLYSPADVEAGEAIDDD